MENQNNCIFCKIISKEISAPIAYEDEEIIVFPTLRPHKEGHILVVPKEHTDYVFDMENEKLASFIKKVKKIAIALKKAYPPPSGKIAMFTMGMGVAHVHVHLIPLETESDVDSRNVYTVRDDERIRVAEKVKEALA